MNFTRSQWQINAPEGSKRSFVANEILRRLKNTSRELNDNHIADILKDYMGELAMGGYPPAWREEVLQATLIGYKRIWEDEVLGKTYINRPEHQNRTKRRVERLTGKSTWFQTNTQKTQPTVATRSRPKGTGCYLLASTEGS